MSGTALNDKLLLRAAGLWDIDPVKVHRSVDISGSPERSDLRVVIEGADGKRYVLESLPLKALEVKKTIVERLNVLKKSGLNEVNTYLVSIAGNTIEEIMGRYWKLSCFVDGIELERPGYVFDEWRGKVLSDFLIRLKDVTASSDRLSESTVFSLRDYIQKLSSEINVYNPDVDKRLAPVYTFLDQGFMKNQHKLETTFCHGDYHPINVIWGAGDIKAVIDWEFCGVKPEIYDAANLLGCLGIEQPDSLTGPFAMVFIKHLQEANIFSDFSWKNLIPYMVALRFAWLSEWLRKKDIEMIEMELVYMKILVDNEKQLKDIWEI